jgi:hypothetical protein
LGTFLPTFLLALGLEAFKHQVKILMVEFLEFQAFLIILFPFRKEVLDWD